jgi:oligopeptidase A
LSAALTVQLMLRMKSFRLPEIPPDTPETNPIMRVNEYPAVSQITPQKIVTGCAKLAIEFDVQLGKHAETLKG